MTTLRRFFLVSAVLAACALAATGGAFAAGPSSGRLIVFTRPGASTVDRAFTENDLPAVRELAARAGLEFTMVDAGKGAPPEIGVTPLIVFQNYRGRSIYQGRFNTPDRVRNFIRTARFIPQTAEKEERTRLGIWRMGRAAVWAPLKVAPVTGSPPKGYDHAAFEKEALEAISRGFREFRIGDRVELGRSDRGFYMDFYPWLSEDGTLFLSVALFSQFYCHAPVFEKNSPPITGPWEKREEMFEEAARTLESAVAAVIHDPLSGDSFDAIPQTVPRVGWDALGLALPPRPRSALADAGEVALFRNWRLAKPGPLDPPLVLFRFAPPLERYSGEATSVSGEIHLSEGFRADGGAGSVTVDTFMGITMGDPMLDEAIRGSLMLNAKEFPASSFTIENISSDGRPVAFGEPKPAVVSGRFSLKGKSVPLTVTAEFEPVLTESAKPRLLVRASFSIDLKKFNIEGADGPAPARDTVLVDVNLPFAPAGE